MPGGASILVAEDSEVGQRQWQALEKPLRRATPGNDLTCVTTENAGDLLVMLNRLERQQRHPDLIVLDLHLPNTAEFGGSRKQPGDTARAGVWLALAIRAQGNATSKIALWTNNVIANELNEAFAFLNITVNGRRLGDEVIDKSEDLASQAAKIRELIETTESREPTWQPPTPSVRLTKKLRDTLPFLEAGLRPKLIAEAEFITEDGVISRTNQLRDLLCSDVDTKSSYELKPTIVAKAREAKIPWVPLAYLDAGKNPYLNGADLDGVEIPGLW